MRDARPPETRPRENICVGRRAEVVDEELEVPVVMGENARIDPGAKVGPYSAIVDNFVACAGASIGRSVVADGAYAGEWPELIGAPVRRDAYAQARTGVLERSASGDDVIVGGGATIPPTSRSTRIRPSRPAPTATI